MTKEMIISSNGHETMVAILEEDLVTEVFIERERQRGAVGKVTGGRTLSALPQPDMRVVEHHSAAAGRHLRKAIGQHACNQAYIRRKGAVYVRLQYRRNFRHDASIRWCSLTRPDRG